MSNVKTMVLVSGGLDSTVLLAKAVEQYGSDNVVACCIRYGQKHEKELECAHYQADKYGVMLIELDLTPIFSFNPNSSALLHGSEQNIVHQSYADQLKELGGEGTVSAYVPFRNGLFLSCAASLALQLGCAYVVYGAHRDDACGRAYPDCTLDFINNMGGAIYYGSGDKLTLKAPFMNLTKSDIVSIGIPLNVDFEHTWSCYEGGESPCGTCGTCRDRKAALEANGVTNIK